MVRGLFAGSAATGPDCQPSWSAQRRISGPGLSTRRIARRSVAYGDSDAYSDSSGHGASAGSGEAFARLSTGSAGSAGRPGGVLAVGLLGPLEVSVDGRPVVLTAGRLRALLAVLAMSAGQAVSVDRLAAAVWADGLPRNVRRSLQTYLARLRGALGAESIATTAAGYVLRTESDHVDALRFGRLLEAASAASDAVAERARLSEALGLWRGRPFEGVASEWLTLSETPWLLERYLTALERRLDLDIAARRHGELAAELGELTAQYPLRESLWARLLIVLDRCGRQAEALTRYEMIRERIADELGADPGPELRGIHADLLAGRPLPHPGSAGAARWPCGQSSGQCGHRAESA